VILIANGGRESLILGAGAIVFLFTKTDGVEYALHFFHDVLHLLRDVVLIKESLIVGTVVWDNHSIRLGFTLFFIQLRGELAFVWLVIAFVFGVVSIVFTRLIYDSDLCLQRLAFLPCSVVELNLSQIQKLCAVLPHEFLLLLNLAQSDLS
jgi:hypothetical protein